MSTGDETAVQPTGEKPPRLYRRVLSWMGRTRWFGPALALAVGGILGFLGAKLFGVPAGFSQPLATVIAGLGAVSAGVLAYLNGERSRALSDTQHKADAHRERERHAEDSRRDHESKLRDR